MNAASSAAPVQVPSGILSYQAVQTGDDTLLTITVFASAAHLERAQQQAQDIRKSLSEFDVEEVSNAASGLLS
jgi:ribosomal protein S3AE